jgi:hypothetical protein
MAMNSSGPISLGGTTAGQSIELENGGPGTATISLNDTAVRSLAGVPSGVITMPTNFYGTSNSVTINITLSANTYNYDVWSAVSTNPSYSAGKTTVNLTVNPGVYVGSTSTGAYAMLVPSSFNPGDSVNIINNGFILAKGATGGNGGPGTSGGSPGGAGGSAIYVNRPTTITNNSTVGAGGGGGGGGSGSPQPRGALYGGGGGGGGAGYDPGSGGSGGSPGGTPGGTGTTSSGGGGGAGNGFGSPGGSGGGLGSSGNPGSTPSPARPAGTGGPTGNYITGNSFVTWPATGTRLGGVA